MGLPRSYSPVHISCTLIFRQKKEKKKGEIVSTINSINSSVCPHPHMQPLFRYWIFAVSTFSRMFVEISGPFYRSRLQCRFFFLYLSLTCVHKDTQKAWQDYALPAFTFSPHSFTICSSSVACVWSCGFACMQPITIPRGGGPFSSLFCMLKD